jgi:hypothetical protein
MCNKNLCHTSYLSMPSSYTYSYAHWVICNIYILCSSFCGGRNRTSTVSTVRGIHKQETELNVLYIQTHHPLTPYSLTPILVSLKHMVMHAHSFKHAYKLTHRLVHSYTDSYTNSLPNMLFCSLTYSLMSQTHTESPNDCRHTLYLTIT